MSKTIHQDHITTSVHDGDGFVQLDIYSDGRLILDHTPCTKNQLKRIYGESFINRLFNGLDQTEGCQE